MPVVVMLTTVCSILIAVNAASIQTRDEGKDCCAIADVTCDL